MIRPGKRKRRTREHVIADMSRVHVEAIVVEAGFTAEPVTQDYGYDLRITTFDANGYVEPGLLLFQLKATERIELGSTEESLAFDVDVRDYHLWLEDSYPVFLILYDAVKRVAYWLDVQQYFEVLEHRPKKGSRTCRVRIPRQNVVNGEFLMTARSEKVRALTRSKGVKHAHKK